MHLLIPTSVPYVGQFFQLFSLWFIGHIFLLSFMTHYFLLYAQNCVQGSNKGWSR